MECLTKMARVAMASHCPFIAATGPSSFGCDSMVEIGLPRDLSMIFAGVEYKKLREFRATPEARFTALAVPRILVRPPYGRDTKPVEEFNFEEPYDAEKFGIWMNPAWAHAVCVGQAMRRYGWPARTCGQDGGGRIDLLSVAKAVPKDGELIPLGPLDATITLPREQELSALGFLALLPTRGSAPVVFPNAASCAHGMTKDSVARLNVLLTATRFSHMLRAMVRDRAISKIRPIDIKGMNRWLQDYVSPNARPSSANDAAKQPLLEGRVIATSPPDDPNSVDVYLVIRPYYQFAEVPKQLRLLVGRYPWLPDQ